MYTAADVLLWRNKRISGSVLAGATVIWMLFEWLNYHFLTLVCLALVLSMSALFLWSNAAVFINRLVFALFTVFRRQRMKGLAIEYIFTRNLTLQLNLEQVSAKDAPNCSA